MYVRPVEVDGFTPPSIYAGNSYHNVASSRAFEDPAGPCGCRNHTSTSPESGIVFVVHANHHEPSYLCLACLIGIVVRRWTAVLEVVGSNPAPAKQRIKFLGLLRAFSTRQGSLPARVRLYKRSLVSLVAQAGDQWRAASWKHSLSAAI